MRRASGEGLGRGLTSIRWWSHTLAMTTSGRRIQSLRAFRRAGTWGTTDQNMLPTEHGNKQGLPKKGRMAAQKRSREASSGAFGLLCGRSE